MKPLELEAGQRQVLGKKVGFLRRQGITPANVFGHGIPSVALQIKTALLHQTLARAGTTRLITLKVDNTDPRMVLVQGIQRDLVRGQLVHVDFYQVKMTEKLKAEVPLVLVGDAPAVKEKHGMLLQYLDSLHIECLPADLPHRLEIDLSGLKELDQAILAKDVPLPKGVALLTESEQVVARVERPPVEEVVEAKPAAEVAEVKAEAPKEARAE